MPKVSLQQSSPIGSGTMEFSLSEAHPSPQPLGNAPMLSVAPERTHPPIERPTLPHIQSIAMTDEPEDPEADPETHDNTWDAAEEMDPVAEEGEFVNFMSRVQNRDVETIRAEIDEELRVLNQQRKAAMRDSEDITQQMVGQIQLLLKLFGIPYITAPMEAEAQCAALVELGLVEGIITDDSDVFLFGGQRVFKNMFNQSKTVECFLQQDLARELGLTRDDLVSLAFLLGSDYTEGLPGVGPVLAMELLKEFPGDDGLHRFKQWWRKVQSGRDSAEDTHTAFRKRFVSI
jgi:DNA excision repair protein ERCC-5